MKKFFASIAALLIALGSAFAQDLAQVTEMYNTAAASISSDKAGALKSFEQALQLAEALGEEGAEIVTNCKNVIPDLTLSIGKDMAMDSNFDGAISQINAAIAVAEKYANADVAAEAKELLPQIIMQKATSLINGKQYAEAATALKEVLAIDPANGAAALRLGIALNATGDAAGATEAFLQAAANGQEKTALKQLANINLKQAAADLKAKKYADAVAAALKSAEYSESAQAYQIAAQASQLAGKNNDAITYFEKYLEISPNAKNAGQIAFTVGALYQQAKNNTKAKEYYSKAVSDPKYGAEAKKLLDALK